MTTYSNNFDHAKPFSDQCFQSNLAANVSQSYTVPGAATQKYRAKFVGHIQPTENDGQKFPVFECDFYSYEPTRAFIALDKKGRYFCAERDVRKMLEKFQKTWKRQKQSRTLILYLV